MATLRNKTKVEENGKIKDAEIKAFPRNSESSLLGKLILFVLVLNLIALSYFIFRTPQNFNGQTNLSDKQVYEEKATQTTGSNNAKVSSPSPVRDGVYQFDNPALAHQLLTELDRFEPLPQIFADNLKWDKLYLSITRNDKYCDKTRKHFTESPEKLFLKKSIMLDHRPTSLIRGTVVPKIATDAHPQITVTMPNKFRDKPIFDMSSEISVFQMNSGLHMNYYLGQHYGCINQMYNHIYGATVLNRKSNIAQVYLDYWHEYKDRPQCKFDFIPESYMLKNQSQCNDFFNYIQTAKYEEEKKKLEYVFFRKIGKGAHRGEGVFLFDQKEEENLKKTYENGQKCGQVAQDFQMQRYLSNPLLLEGHKFDFRVYMVIASVNPLIVYYQDGFLKLSAHVFDRNSTDKGVHLSNTEVSKDAFDAAKTGLWLGMNETELRAFQTWTYSRLQNYLIEKGYTKDPNWIENSLRQQMKKIMVHLAKMSKPGFLKRSQSFELFGCDFILEEDLKLWFIEANTSPIMEATTPDREKILVKMLSDHFELIFGLLRSRMKRVILFINKLLKEIPDEYKFYDTVVIPDLEFNKHKLEFDAINTNYFEPEFEISPTSGFQKIIDENLKDLNIYSGYITQECL